MVVKLSVPTIVLVFCLGSCSLLKSPAPAPFVARIPDYPQQALPLIGKWLQYENGQNADWLGRKYKNRTLQEPINVIFIDAKSKSEGEAITGLMSECKKNGYEEEYGHSSKYTGLINNSVYKQIPNDKHMAFSNKDFFRINNHGRIIGPALYEGQYIFIAAFSREKPTIKNGLMHSFVSFVQARDDFVMHMNSGSSYKIAGKIFLENTADSAATTTGDHDGIAVVLETK